MRKGNLRFSFEVGKREEEQGLISVVMAFSAAGERIHKYYCNRLFFARSHHSLIVGLGKSLLNIQFKMASFFLRE